MSSPRIPKRPFNITDGDLVATLLIGDRYTLNAPPAYIEMMVVTIEQYLNSERGFGWLHLSTGDPNEPFSQVLVSRSSNISVQWPAGYEPFSEPNAMVDEILQDPVA